MKLWNDFTKFEKVWLATFTFAIMTTTIWFSYLYTDYSSITNIILNWFVSPVSALTGIVCVVLAAKGKISTFTWGVVNCLTYGTLAFLTGVYGDAIINLLYFLPLQFVGFAVWKKKMKGDTVVSEKLNNPVITAVAAILAWIGFSSLLSGTDGFLVQTFAQNSIFYTAMPKGLGVMIDASTEVLQFFGQLLMTVAKRAQWYFWIATNAVSIFIWSVILVSDFAGTAAFAVPTLIMWGSFLINSIYGLTQWGSRIQPEN